MAARAHLKYMDHLYLSLTLQNDCKIMKLRPRTIPTASPKGNSYKQQIQNHHARIFKRNTNGKVLMCLKCIKQGEHYKEISQAHSIDQPLTL